MYGKERFIELTPNILSNLGGWYVLIHFRSSRTIRMYLLWPGTLQLDRLDAVLSYRECYEGNVIGIISEVVQRKII
jgi:hypothetical protein